MNQRLGGAGLKTIRANSIPNIKGLRPPGKFGFKGRSLINRLFNKQPTVHGKFFIGAQGRGMTSTTPALGKLNALKGGIPWSGPK